MTMRHVGWFVLLLLGLTFMAILWALYLWLMPVKTFDVKNFSYEQPIHIETPVVHAGDIVRYTLQYCKYTDVIPVSKSQLIDGQIIPLTPSMPTQSGLPQGCHTTERDIVIPRTVNPGRYYYNKELDYHTSPFHTEKVYYYTEYFQIVPNSIPSTSVPGATNETPDIPTSPLTIASQVQY